MDIGHLPNPAPSVLINLKAATIRSTPGACGRPKAVSVLDRHIVRHAPDTGNGVRVIHHPPHFLLDLRNPHHVHDALDRPGIYSGPSPNLC